MASPGRTVRLRRYLRGLAADPVEGLLYLPERVSEWRRRPASYAPDEEWERLLHRLLDAPWPCPERSNVEALYEQVKDELAAQGLAFGRYVYGGYSDADLGLVGAVWCAVVHRRPRVVVETGVARGVTSRIVLEALARNGLGALWSIDLPHPFEPTLRTQTAVAVPLDSPLRRRWTYVEGSSRRRLRSLLRQLPSVDVFLHDSLHTPRNTMFEMTTVGQALAPEGVMFVDDIATHQAFDEFRRTRPEFRSLVGRHSDGLGLFGAAVRGRASAVGTPTGKHRRE